MQQVGCGCFGMKPVKGEGEWRVILAYLAVCIIWGSTYLAIRIGVSEFPPELFAGIRFSIAGGLLLLYEWWRGHKFPSTWSDVRKQATVGLFLLLGGNGLVVWTEQWVHSGITALLLASVPLFMALVELALPDGSRLDFKGWAGLLLGFSGVALLVLSGSSTNSIDLLGGSLLLLASFLWACGSVYSKRLTPTGTMISNIGIQMLAAGIALFLLGVLLGELPQVHVTYRGMGAMVYLIFVGSMLGYSSYTYILRKMPASKAGTYAYINPIVAVILGALILSEPVSPNMLVSAAIILGGVLLVQVSKSSTAGAKNKGLASGSSDD